LVSVSSFSASRTCTAALIEFAYPHIAENQDPVAQTLVFPGQHWSGLMAETQHSPGNAGGGSSRNQPAGLSRKCDFRQLSKWSNCLYTEIVAIKAARSHSDEFINNSGCSAQK
jgi:hypothetical protein